MNYMLSLLPGDSL